MKEVRRQKLEVGTKKAEAGFTIVELMITMVAFVFVIAAASQMLTGLMTQFKQQSKIAETNIEGIIGLNILRQDIEHAGYGLPWVYPVALSPYTEATSAPASSYNDTATTPPRALLSCNGDNTTDCSGILSGSDYLVIKAVNVSTNNTATKWALLADTGILRDDISGDAFTTEDVVTIISPGSTGTNSRTLVSYNTSYDDVDLFRPEDNTDVRIVYGINAPIEVPFNRADYYIRSLAINELPRCATGTGVLVKESLGPPPVPILDCVADLQVVYAMDNDEDGDFENGMGDAYTNSLAGLTAQEIRTRVKEVQVYILAHEGQRDPNFTFDNFTDPPGPCGDTCILVGRSAEFGRDFNISAITDYEDYRWKIYTIVVKPENLGS